MAALKVNYEAGAVSFQVFHRNLKVVKAQFVASPVPADGVGMRLQPQKPEWEIQPHDFAVAAVPGKNVQGRDFSSVLLFGRTVDPHPARIVAVDFDKRLPPGKPVAQLTVFPFSRCGRDRSDFEMPDNDKDDQSNECNAGEHQDPACPKRDP